MSILLTRLLCLGRAGKDVYGGWGVEGGGGGWGVRGVMSSFSGDE